MDEFSPAFSGGLIEALRLAANPWDASLFSPAFSGGLIEARLARRGGKRIALFSPAFSGGLIEARPPADTVTTPPPVFPRVQRGPH